MILKNYGLIILCLIICFSCSESSSQKRIEDNDSKSRILDSFSTKDTLKNSFYYSLDKGISWKSFHAGLTKDVQTTFIDTLGEHLVIGTEAHGLFISPQNTPDWKPFATNLPGKKISALHIKNGILYVGVFKMGIYQSRNRGRTWDALNGDLPDLKPLWAVCNRLKKTATNNPLMPSTPFLYKRVS